MRIGSSVGGNGRSVLIQRMLEERDFRSSRTHVLHDVQRRRQRSRDRPRDAAASRRDRREGIRRPRRDRHLPGGDYSNDMLPKLRAAGWSGYWIDAASALRMKDDAGIVLDPVNRDVIDAALKSGIRLHRRQLHGVADDDGDGGVVPARRRRVDDVHDVPVGVRRRRPEHARAPRADGEAHRPRVILPMIRSRRSSTSIAKWLASSAIRVPDGAFRRAAGGSLIRGSTRTWAAA